MHSCPACGGALVRLPSSRLDQLVGSVTGRRPFACSECLWVGRRLPPPDHRRGPQSAVRDLQSGIRGPQPAMPHRRRSEALSTCPICGHDTIAQAAMRRIDRIVAALTRRVPLACTYCHWTGRRRVQPGVAYT